MTTVHSPVWIVATVCGVWGFTLGYLAWEDSKKYKMNQINRTEIIEAGAAVSIAASTFVFLAL